MKNNTQNKKTSLIPNLAKKIGEKSVSAVSVWWYHQPQVPASMKDNSKKN